jgi:hypothetical protein
VIVDDFYLVGSAVSPHEADSPLVIDADAVLTCAAAFEQLQLVSWRSGQIRQAFSLMDLPQLTLRRPLEIVAKPTGEPAMKQRFGIAISEGSDHIGAYIRTTL